MTYRAEQITEMRRALDEWTARSDDLSTRLAMRRWRHERTGEFVRHGLARRLETLRFCIGETFDAVPPDAAHPSRHEVLTATVHIHAFLANAYGAVDNLARVWVMETGLTRANGRPLEDGEIGFTARCERVRETLPTPLREHVQAMDEWMHNLSDYRNALAHRIPPYIPPNTLTPADAEQWRGVEAEAAEARAAGDWRSVAALIGSLSTIGTFEPLLTHSFGEQAEPLRFHPQTISDLATVVELGEAVERQIE